MAPQRNDKTIRPPDLKPISGLAATVESQLTLSVNPCVIPSPPLNESVDHPKAPALAYTHRQR